MSWRLIIRRESKSGNAFAYSHWRNRSSDRTTWVLMVRSVANGYCPPATGKRLVTFDAFRKRRLDDDNLSGGLKHCRDALKVLELIKDDNAAGASFIYRQHVLSDLPPDLLFFGRRVPTTVITLEDLP